MQQAVRRGAAQAECYLEAGAGLDVELEKGHIAGASSSRSFGGTCRATRGAGGLAGAHPAPPTRQSRMRTR
ncbi:MAG TPA: hypothetical protein VFH47_05995, partial [Candidatus Thermoplasmatota archaeon]|nr:hypothetical protein [Candidatus Thermoplasmatota archaeon]